MVLTFRRFYLRLLLDFEWVYLLSWVYFLCVYLHVHVCVCVQEHMDAEVRGQCQVTSSFNFLPYFCESRFLNEPELARVCLASEPWGILCLYLLCAEIRDSCHTRCSLLWRCRGSKSCPYTCMQALSLSHLNAFPYCHHAGGLHNSHNGPHWAFDHMRC